MSKSNKGAIVAIGLVVIVFIGGIVALIIWGMSGSTATTKPSGGQTTKPRQPQLCNKIVPIETAKNLYPLKKYPQTNWNDYETGNTAKCKQPCIGTYEKATTPAFCWTGVEDANGKKPWAFCDISCSTPKDGLNYINGNPS